LHYTYLDCLALFGVGGAHPGGLRLTKQILSEEKINEQTAMLEIGCGTGQTAAHLAQQYGCSISALDNNGIMVEKARQRFNSLDSPVDIKLGDTENLPYPEANFDIVLSESVLAFTNVGTTIPELKRVLKPNGILLAIETVLEQPIPETERDHIMDFYTFPQLWTEAEWLTVFKQAGFQQIDSTTYQASSEQIDEQHAADFTLSEDIDDALLEILEKHQEITKQYKDILGYRIFRCR